MTDLNGTKSIISQWQFDTTIDERNTRPLPACGRVTAFTCSIHHRYHAPFPVVRTWLKICIYYHRLQRQNARLVVSVHIHNINIPRGLPLNLVAALRYVSVPGTASVQATVYS